MAMKKLDEELKSKAEKLTVEFNEKVLAENKPSKIMAPPQAAPPQAATP
jgi:hypothetical protein